MCIAASAHTAPGCGKSCGMRFSEAEQKPHVSVVTRDKPHRLKSVSMRSAIRFAPQLLL
jgi:hypothetical protein